MESSLLELFEEIDEWESQQALVTKTTAKKPAHKPKRTKKVVKPQAKLAMLQLPEQSDLEGKERNRLIVKRYYYRKLTTLSELREEAERLEAQYEQLIRSDWEASLSPSSSEELGQKTRLMMIRDAFVELAMMSKALRLENERYQLALNEYDKTEKLLTQTYITQYKNAERSHEVMLAKKQNPVIHVRQLSMQECAEIMSQSYDRVRHFRESTQNFSSGVSVFGWRDRYRYDKKDIDFSIEKTYRHQPREAVADKVWEILSDGEAFARLYPASINAKFNAVQRLDDNNILYYHTLEMSQQSDMLTKCLLLCSRISVMDGDACIIIIRTIDPRLYVISEGEVDTARDTRGRQKIEPKVEEAWIDVFVWLLYRRDGPNGEHCAAEFGGTLIGTPMLDASFWLVERLQSAMKLEQLLFGPTNLLPA
ncbi:hypothetical protein Poli38472_014262 [Pythium oligandrum]|uniref:Uncharacterized protein n=1 Tax=Pythium oligandrum TaxID=41045 RepID=A0A8K1CK56_PYTOL|nr:hypothetical protein Poli38472_014262 [Pythium oligandrum]|eukprot:TMW64145.1 hypothetical protein Poli38472_014262 [Pythium oligandrum]